MKHVEVCGVQMPTIQPSKQRFVAQRRSTSSAQQQPNLVMLHLAFDTAINMMDTLFFEDDQRFVFKRINLVFASVHETTTPLSALWVELKRGGRGHNTPYERIEVQLQNVNGCSARLRFYPFHAAEWRVYGMIVKQATAERRVVEAEPHDIHKRVLDVVSEITGVALPWPSL